MIALTLKISSKGIVIRALVFSWPTVECPLSVITMYIIRICICDNNNQNHRKYTAVVEKYKRKKRKEKD
jgi:hypothetical protein